MLKKPQRVTVRHFFQRVEQLKGYLSYLPCTYDSPRATGATKPVPAFNEAELANLLLRMCPETWQDQYDLTQESTPQSVRKLLGILENVKKVVGNSTAKDKTAKESAENGAGKHGKGKHKGTGSNNIRVPKKARVEKSCALCQKHGGAHTTHNTSECRKCKRVLVQKQPLGRNVTAAVRKNCAIPSRRLWNASRDSRKRSKRPAKAPERRNIATKVVTLVIPTPNRIVGTVVL